MMNAERIVAALDRHLQHEVLLILYGRGAIALAFDDAPDSTKKTLDVDAIIPLSRVSTFQQDGRFWDAQEATNQELEKDGLYITHLFQADQVFLRRDWEQHLVPITTRPALRWLRLFRPATLDLILTKMMRGDDAQDLADIAFLIDHDKITPGQIENALAEAVIPDLAELREAFERAKPLVRELARKASA